MEDSSKAEEEIMSESVFLILLVYNSPICHKKNLFKGGCEAAVNYLKATISLLRYTLNSISF